MTVITRFAPSPTGFLHIGGARTALFNWLFAHANNGKFLLRIEDTDSKRSTVEAIDAIIDGLKWLGLNWDGEIVYQSKNSQRHAEVANELLQRGNAYHCYCTPEELAEMREKATTEKKPFRYDGRWRDSDKKPPTGIAPVIRLKTPLEGETHIHDLVQGDVIVPNSDLEDLILLRSDGTPTYMLAAVVDDHDMAITHIIRGDDHLTNSFKQKIIYESLGWKIPDFAHIPLIHGPDGAKLSKRHGALGVDAYRDMGYLPEAMRNYLLRLGWSHGDEEIISTERALKVFNIEAIGRSPARIDFDKMSSVNAHYMREADNTRLVDLIKPLIEKRLDVTLSDNDVTRLSRGMNGLKERAKTLVELAENALFYIQRPAFTDKALAILDEGAKGMLEKLLTHLEESKDWKAKELEIIVGNFAENGALKLGKVAQPLRASLTGSNVSPGIFEVMEVLGKEEILRRLRDI